MAGGAALGDDGVNLSAETHWRIIRFDGFRPRHKNETDHDEGRSGEQPCVAMSLSSQVKPVSSGRTGDGNAREQDPIPSMPIGHGVVSTDHDEEDREGKVVIAASAARRPCPFLGQGLLVEPWHPPWLSDRE